METQNISALWCINGTLGGPYRHFSGIYGIAKFELLIVSYILTHYEGMLYQC